MYTLLKPGDIPAIFNPEFISIKEADKSYSTDEPLIAVVDGDEAKAFSTWHLDHHEIVNDYINGKDIVFGIREVYRDIAFSKNYLINNRYGYVTLESSSVFIMYDKETESVRAFRYRQPTHYSQIKVDDNNIEIKVTNSGTVHQWDAKTGKALMGTDIDLISIPVITAYWFAWASFFPETELIK